MIKKEEQVNTEELTHRRKGGAFDDFARILRKINKIFFSTGIVLEDRPGDGSGEYVKSPSVFSMYHQKEAKKDEYNFLFFGREGRKKFQNTNYIEFSANSKDGQSDGKDQVANGNIAFSIYKNGVKVPGGISLMNLDSLARANNLLAAYKGLDGFVGIFEARQHGQISLNYTFVDSSNNPTNQYSATVSETGVELSYLDKKGSPIYLFRIDSSGISIHGLPTSAPSGSNKLYKSSNYVRITT